ncbi:MAG: sigma-70 family RNA polymerase sigma factor, partial [Firmicutes bacterium]|nr:sigma-70 family RNA polymerase sigma factor [Bacillota bacterium]
FSTWLITIALNTRKNKLRTAWREVPSKEAFETNAEVESAEERALRHLAVDEAASLLNTLGPDKRQVFVLRHYYGLKYQEIADAVGCPIGTVRSRLHDSVDMLRREMARRDMA